MFKDQELQFVWKLVLTVAEMNGQDPEELAKEVKKKIEHRKMSSYVKGFLEASAEQGVIEEESE